MASRGGRGVWVEGWVPPALLPFFFYFLKAVGGKKNREPCFYSKTVFLFFKMIGSFKNMHEV